MQGLQLEPAQELELGKLVPVQLEVAADIEAEQVLVDTGAEEAVADIAIGQVPVDTGAEQAVADIEAGQVPVDTEVVLRSKVEQLGNTKIKLKQSRPIAKQNKSSLNPKSYDEVLI